MGPIVFDAGHLEHDDNDDYSDQGFAWSWYLSRTCNLQAEFVCFDWADKM